MKTKETIQQFDSFLADKGLTLTAVVVGGAALALLDVISRETRDCDVIHPDLPEEIQQAAVDFSQRIKKQGNDLQPDWLNNGPSSLVDLLPDGWMKRVRPVFTGRALQLSTLGRDDLLKTKLFAYCDRGTDLEDCLALNPTSDELTEALDWLKDQDAHPDWPRHVQASMEDMAERLGHEL